MKRNLSGIYFRSKNEQTGVVENVCFEDLPDNEKDLVLTNFSHDQLRSLVKMLSRTIREIGDELDIVKE